LAAAQTLHATVRQTIALPTELNRIPKSQISKAYPVLDKDPARKTLRQEHSSRILQEHMARGRLHPRSLGRLGQEQEWPTVSRSRQDNSSWNCPRVVPNQENCMARRCESTSLLSWPGARRKAERSSQPTRITKWSDDCPALHRKLQQSITKTSGQDRIQTPPKVSTTPINAATKGSSRGNSST